jgi:DNA-binding NarL/FixJ family response regulator
MLDDDESVLAAIRAVATGGAVFGAAVAGRTLAALDRTPAPAFPELTDRESEVLTLMAEGRDNRAIATELEVSVKTVANHVSRILTKLQARDRVDAVLRARDAGR